MTLIWEETVIELGLENVAGCDPFLENGVVFPLPVITKSVEFNSEIIPLPIASAKPKLQIIEPTLLEGLSRMFGCRHKWGFPQTNPVWRRTQAYPLAYDSHQSCNSCGAKRLYDFRANIAGPFFKETL